MIMNLIITTYNLQLHNKKKILFALFLRHFCGFGFMETFVKIQCFPLGNLFWYNNQCVILYSFWDNYITLWQILHTKWPVFMIFFENASYCNTTTYFECVFWSQYSWDTIFAIRQHFKNSNVAMLLVCTSNNTMK